MTSTPLKNLLALLCFLPFTLAAQWQPINTNVYQEFLELDFVSDLQGFALMPDPQSLSTQRFIATTDGGQTWTTVALPHAGDYQSMDFVDALNGYLSGRYSNGSVLECHVYKTTNGGQNWTDVSPNIQDAGYGNSVLRFWNPLKGNFLVGSNQYATTDGGATWDTISLGMESGLCMATSGSQQAAFGTWDGTFAYTGGVFTTNDGGATWNFSDFTDWNSQITQISYPEFNHIFALANSYAPFIAPRLYRSQDGGASWDTLHPQIWVDSNATPQSMHFVNGALGYVNTLEGHIFVTSDSGNTWQLDYLTAEAQTVLSAGGSSLYSGGDLGSLYQLDLPLGSEPKPTFPGLLAFPNPVTDRVGITTTFSESVHVQILNAQGKILQITNLQPGHNQLDLPASLPSGVFFLHLHGQGISETHKMIRL
ncbi:MAG: T9SS type A sorting domain-containing protein [Bacteroidia bacterium]|nr:T9SS type A sorting domain-containing protein [Bacteroidia bacterium]